MRYRVFEGGAIACSAIAIWGWITAPQPASTACESTPPQDSDRPMSRPTRCRLPPQIGRAGMLPGNLLNLHWGRDRLSPDLEQVYAKVLTQAQAMVDRDRVPEAILALGGIPKNSQQFPLAQQLQNEWAQDLLEQATQRYAQADLKPALQLLQSIPATSPAFSEAQALSQQWRQEADWFNQAQAAVQAGQWQGVMRSLQRLEGSSLYHSSRVQTMLQLAMSQAFAPDRRLVEVAASNTETTVTSQPKIPTVQSSSTTLDSLPNPTQLEIKTDKALTWAQPQKASAIAKPHQSQVRPQGSSSRNRQQLPTDPIFPIKVPQRSATQPPPPAIAPPESFPAEDF